MGYAEKLNAGYAACINEGCPNPSHSKTVRGMCKSCYNKEWQKKKAAGWVFVREQHPVYQCTTEGCANPAKTTTKPGPCIQCYSVERYHKKHPNAPRRPIGHHGKWKGKICATEGCGSPVQAKGLCSVCGGKANYYTRKAKGTHYCPVKRSDAHLKMQYGITGAAYDRMFAEQGGECAICGEPPHDGNTPAKWKVRRLAVDHCHATGKVRALLCNACNLMVKKRHTPDLLRKAIAYIERHV